MTQTIDLNIGDKVIAKALLNRLSALNDDQKINLVNFAIAKLAHDIEPYPEPPQTSDEYVCKELIQRLTTLELLRLIQYTLNSIYPPDTEKDAAEAYLKKYINYDFRKHLDCLGISYPLASIDFMENMKMIANCLDAYRIRLQQLEAEVDSALDTLELVAEIEGSVKHGNWQASKNGVITRLAIKVAIQARDLLALTYKSQKKTSDEF